jgi:hypothetical protein
MDVPGGTTVNVNVGQINNGMDLAVLRYHVEKWVGESMTG